MTITLNLTQEQLEILAGVITDAADEAIDAIDNLDDAKDIKGLTEYEAQLRAIHAMLITTHT